MAEPFSEHYHHLSAGESAELLETDLEQGLDLFAAKHRTERYGPNQISVRGGPGRLVRFLLQFHQPLIYILIAAGAVTLYLAEYIDAIVIFGVVLLNAVIGYVQEAKAVEALSALARTMTTEATVIRGGERRRMPATELVPGDLVALQSGDKVPADLRLTRTRDLQIDESALTGESLPVHKDGHAVPRDTPLAERHSMAYASSLVTYGAGHGLVVATGNETEVGRISKLISEAEALQTPLTRKLAKFGKVLLVIILAVGVVTFVIGLLRGQPVTEMFEAAIALAVAAVPEGLPAAVTITLAIGVARMAQRRAIIRKLPAVETLGGTTVICTDKTGTLTENQMTVQRIITADRDFLVDGTGYAPNGGLRPADGGQARQSRDVALWKGEAGSGAHTVAAAAGGGGGEIRSMAAVGGSAIGSRSWAAAGGHSGLRARAGDVDARLGADAHADAGADAHADAGAHVNAGADARAVADADAQADAGADARARDGAAARAYADAHGDPDEGGPYAGDGHRQGGPAAGVPSQDLALQQCLLAGVLCNDSRVVEEDGRWVVHGDPTEAALEVAAHKAGITRAAALVALPRRDTFPFESRYQYMATLHGRDRRSPIVYLKGSAEAVLARCHDQLGPDGSLQPLNKRAVAGRVEELAAGGLRVLAFARRELPDRANLRHEDVDQGLTFLGLQAMIDPPRPEAITAVAACRSAGISVKMITGDHMATAAAIAAEMGIGEIDETAAGEDGRDRQTPRTITGRQMEVMHDAELIDVAAGVSVFARVSPEQKLRLVEALQARGNVVAMTGDGVNDAPALKQADIGVAMGVTGTDVAKDAADMVLTDDNFASVEAAVEEGRGVFDNLVKFITYALPTNLGQGLVLLAAVLAGLTLPILPLQILWINMTTAVFLGLGLAFEPKEEGLMRRRPRPAGASIVSTPMVVLIVVTGLILLAGAFGLFEWAQSRGLSLAEARTVAVNTFMAVQTFYLFNCRSLRGNSLVINPFSNRMLIAGVGIMAALQVVYTYVPFMNVAFDSAPLAGLYWLPIIGLGVAAFLLVEAVKWVLRTTYRERIEG